jgi:hypothetical protein
MPRHIALYKRYDTAIGLQPGKEYVLISYKESNNLIKVTIINQRDLFIAPLVYTSEWELLQDWHILKTWKERGRH